MTKPMDDLISRQAAIELLECKKDKNAKGDIGGFYNKIIQNDIDTLMQLPTAERKGKWKISDLPKGQMKYCSECGFGKYIADVRTYHYCPNCGAKMEENE